MAKEINIKYRTWVKGFPPRPIQLGDWAGDKNYVHAQPWHCKPFIDGSTYGCELLYPFETEVTVTNCENELIWTGDFTKEKENIKQPAEWERPFASFSPHHFGMTSCLDIKTEEGYGTLILPHPRYYTDRTGTTPLPVAGILESSWWSRIFFVVFKSPLEGQTYVFRHGEPYAQVIFVPMEINYNIKKMTTKEQIKRAKQEAVLRNNYKSIATKVWKDVNGEEFDNKYKQLSNLAKKKGIEEIEKLLEEVEKNSNDIKLAKQEVARKKFPRKLIHAKKNNHQT